MSNADLLEAIRLLVQLKERIMSEEWVMPRMQNAVLTGIKLSIQTLSDEITKR